MLTDTEFDQAMDGLNRLAERFLPAWEGGAAIAARNALNRLHTESSQLRQLFVLAAKGNGSLLDVVSGIPKIVVLCGSTRFRDAFERANHDETLAGNIVLSVGCLTHGNADITEEQKARLDELHKRKIDLAHEVLILNVDGYVGDSTASEIRYARHTGKDIRWLEPDKIPEWAQPEEPGQFYFCNQCQMPWTTLSGGTARPGTIIDAAELTARICPECAGEYRRAGMTTGVLVRPKRDDA